MNRHETLLAHIDLEHGRGLEIGALHHPIVGRHDGNVLYVDHASTEDLKAKYLGDAGVGDVNEMVDVDVVWSGRRLSEAVGDAQAVDWVVASHVIEHVPDLVGWLGELAEVLAPGGVLSLAIPDKRYCFDAKRSLTEVSDLVESALIGRSRPSLAAIYDFWSRIMTVDALSAWNGQLDIAAVEDDDSRGLDKCRQVLTSDEYSDVHCSVFTSESFLDALGRLMALGLVPWYELVDFHHTAHGDLEFFATMRRFRDDLSDEERTTRQSAGLLGAMEGDSSEAAATDSMPEVAEDSSPVAAVPAFSGLSSKEVRLIESKRLLMTKVRGGVRTVMRRSVRSGPQTGT